jgi:hypothetical protein
VTAIAHPKRGAGTKVPAWLCAVSCWTALTVAPAGPAAAQTPQWLRGALPAAPATGGLPPASAAPGPSKQEAPAARPPALAAAKPDQSPVRNADTLLILIRTSLLTLNDALTTGNFTVLRDKVAPSVREQNSAARLYQVFARLMEQRIDLRATAILAPEMSEVPAVDAAGRLNLKGAFRAHDGTGLAFHLAFEAVNGQWMLYGASVNMVQAATAGAAPAQAKAAPVTATSSKRAANPRPAAAKQPK